MRAFPQKGEMFAEECPPKVPLRCPFPIRSKKEMLWAQRSLLDSYLSVAKINPGESSDSKTGLMPSG